jgi:hypothetical protein
MAKLVIHVGPAKCGSSSIQHYFSHLQQPSAPKKRVNFIDSFRRKEPPGEKIRFAILDPEKISQLNCEEPSESTESYFTELLSGNLQRSDFFIISHEFLFQCPLAVKNICSMADSQAVDTCVIGYSRRQSDFLISAYSQWIFRAPDRINEVAQVLDGLKLEAVLFTGLERYIVACIVNDFYCARQLSEFKILDWYACYHNLEQLVSGYGTTVKCGVLFGKEANKSLIEDFVEKAGLTFMFNENRNDRQLQVNTSFNPDIVEAVNNGVVYGLQMPGPHDSNDMFAKLSSKIDQSSSVPSEFILHLKSYVDTYYEQSNMQLCDKYDLPKDCFIPPERINKSEILEIIVDEGQKRSSNYPQVIEQYRMLSARLAELCIKLAKGS